MNISSLGNARYFVLFIDDFSRFRFIFCVKKIREVFECFKKVKAKKLRVARNAMVKFKSHNGGEYIICAFKEYLVEAIIKHETSTFYYP
jgi:CRISPR/Cas system Type II protein with McrA/HNH and RuvC-like nuclease domain